MTLVSKNVYIGDKLDDIVRFFDIVRISKYKNVFAKGTLQIVLKKFL